MINFIGTDITKELLIVYTLIGIVITFLIVFLIVDHVKSKKREKTLLTILVPTNTVFFSFYRDTFTIRRPSDIVPKYNFSIVVCIIAVPRKNSFKLSKDIVSHCMVCVFFFTNTKNTQERRIVQCVFPIWNILMFIKYFLEMFEGYNNIFVICSYLSFTCRRYFHIVAIRSHVCFS